MSSARIERILKSQLLHVTKLVRAVGVGTLAGVASGVIVGGLGSRVAMRISALTTGPLCPGMVTENGNRCGEITLGGTLELVLFGGVFSGVVGGLLYAALRPWLAGLRRWRGLLFGLLLFAMFGSVIIDGDNRDFRRFGFPTLNVVLFAALFPLFGIVLEPLAERLGRIVPEKFPSRRLGIRAVAAYVAMGITGALALAFVLKVISDSIVQWLSTPGEFELLPGVVSLLFLYLLFLVPIARRVLMPVREGLAVQPHLLGPQWRELARLVLLGIPILTGAFLTLQAIFKIL